MRMQGDEDSSERPGGTARADTGRHDATTRPSDGPAARRGWKRTAAIIALTVAGLLAVVVGYELVVGEWGPGDIVGGALITIGFLDLTILASLRPTIAPPPMEQSHLPRMSHWPI